MLFCEADLSEIRGKLLESLSEPELDELIDAYVSAYGGILSSEEAFEEICCDAMGEMNIFEGTQLNSESYEKALSLVRDYAADKGGNKSRAPPAGGVKYSINNTRDMPWKNQVQGYFSNDGTIKSSDSLYLGESNVNGVKDAPMYIPTSVITKAIRPPRGSRSAHALSQKNILGLQDSIKNAPLVINDPVRNSIVYVTADQDSAGNYIIVTLEKNNDLYGENTHKVTSIHGR